MNTASSTTAAQGAHSGATAFADGRPRPGLGGAFRALKVFAGAAVSVVLLGESADKRAVRAM
ncbi:hypothetical protein ACFQ2B_18760 [Streptomyces stramineus]